MNFLHLNLLFPKTNNYDKYEIFIYCIFVHFYLKL